MFDFFKKIFGKELPETPSDGNPARVSEPITLPVSGSDSSVSMGIPVEAWPDSPQIVVGWGQSVGKQRDHNEDAMYVFSTVLISENEQQPFGLFIVADGMGGHQHGEIASSNAIRAMSNYVIQKLYLPLFCTNPSYPDDSLQEIMKGGVTEAHQAILRYAPGGGTTMTAALIVGDRMTLSHVGDSRAYLFQANGETQVLTRDHSLVKRLEELGQLTPEEAAQHPQRNVLYRALGQGEPFEPDIQTYPIPAHGYLVICSDGLWGLVSADNIFSEISNNPDLHKACQNLVDAANQAGGPDNITIIAVRLTG